MSKFDFSFGNLKISIENIPHWMIPLVLVLVLAIVAIW